MDATQRNQVTEALLEVALLETRFLERHLVEIIGYLEKKEHLAALGTIQGLEDRWTFLRTVLVAAARLPQHHAQENLDL